ncbi:MAG: hypothetical protein IKW45_02500 [Clostridia bacterium]|nr:hypothetical protein [Clostridia bacterium]
MKKIISIILVLTMLILFVACGEEETELPGNQTTAPLNTEVLKADWKAGTLVFPGDKTVKFPCTLNEFITSSGATINNGNAYDGKMLEPNESVTLYISVEDANMKLTVKNTKKEAVGCMDSFVLGYSYNYTNEANTQIKFAGTLSPGVSRIDVEKALEIPEGKTSEDVLYVYQGRNDKNKKVELNIAFNSYGVVNSVSYEILN